MTKKEQTFPASADAPSAVQAAPRSPLHPRNRHRGRYDFPRLVAADAALGQYVGTNPLGEPSIDFANPAAVVALNRALLKDSYGVDGWGVPAGNLCPSIPGRADYLLYLADVLAERNDGVVPPGKSIQVLDIGTGANCIYPLIGASEFGWRFVATDINADSLRNAQGILDANPKLARQIVLRAQNSSAAILDGVVNDEEWFDLTVCNPPFHSSLAEARMGTARKWKNLGLDVADEEAEIKANSKTGHKAGNNKAGVNLNFGGQDAELWCPGGELTFIQKMIKESAKIPTRCFWFSTLVSKSASLPGIYESLKRVKVLDHKTIEMSQGKKISRLVAWTFLSPVQQAAWRKLRW